MKGDTADPSPSTINTPNKIKTIIIGINQYCFFLIKKEKKDLAMDSLLISQN